ncbi:MAG: hypothetical protein ACI35W_06750 [Anaeroplasmataceae bacterium]
MRVFMSILKCVFCPFWFFYEHNANERITQTKKEYVKYLCIIPIVIIILVLTYLKDIINLFK